MPKTEQPLSTAVHILRKSESRTLCGLRHRFGMNVYRCDLDAERLRQVTCKPCKAAKQSKEKTPERLHAAIVDTLMELGGGRLYDYDRTTAEKRVRAVLKRYGL